MEKLLVPVRALRSGSLLSGTVEIVKGTEYLLDFGCVSIDADGDLYANLYSDSFRYIGQIKLDKMFGRI